MDFHAQFLIGTSFRHSSGRRFWNDLRRVREHVNTLWDFWPDCNYPDIPPELPADLLGSITIFIPTLPAPNFCHFPPVQEIPMLLWCFGNWVQLEIVLRNLSLNIDAFFCKYESGHNLREYNFDDRMDVVRHVKLLRDNMIQLYWWLHALFVRN
jgi:hypothetical protein